MWTITDGGYEGSPYGYEAPSLYRIDAETFQVEKQFKFKLGDWPSEVQLNREGDMLYWINKDIWQMSVDADRVPVRPFLKYSNTIYYGLTVDPKMVTYMWQMPLIISKTALYIVIRRKEN